MNDNFRLEFDLATLEPHSAHDYGRISKAIELILAGRLMLRRHHISLPFQDDGVDLIVDYKLLVQVKSSAIRNASGQLIVSLDGRRSSARRTESSRAGRLRHDIDVLACYARDTDTWWFIPRFALEKTGAMTADRIGLSEQAPRYRSKNARLSEYRDCWDVFSGHTPHLSLT